RPRQERLAFPRKRGYPMLPMHRLLALTGVLLTFGHTPGLLAGPITMTVTPSLAPNLLTSPNAGGYVSNALIGLEPKLAGFLTASAVAPAAYGSVTSILPSDIVVTGTPSWHGFANPGSVFGASFAAETGNRLHFGLVLKGNGTPVKLSLLSFSMVS